MSPAERHLELDRGFGRDGISGLLNPNRAMRARDVSRPSPDDLRAARYAAEAAVPRSEAPRS